MVKSTLCSNSYLLINVSCVCVHVLVLLYTCVCARACVHFRGEFVGIGSLLPWCGSWGSELRWLGLAACVFYLLSHLVVLAVTFLMRLLGNSAYAQSQLLPTNMTLVIWTRASITGEYSVHRDSRRTSVTLVIWMLASITGEYSVHRDLRYTK